MIALRLWPVLGRWSVFVLACVGYGSAAVLSLVFLLAHAALSVSWPWFLLTTVISLAFFGVGCLVWWYARQRRVATLFFGVCISFAFSLLLAVPSEVAGRGFLNALSSLSASTGIFFLLFLFLHFPHPLLRPWKKGSWRMRMLWGWLAFLGLLSVLSALYCVTGARVPPASLFEPWYTGYFLGTTLSLLGALVAATRIRLSRRERQQLRLLFAGFGLGLAPWICFSLLPDLVHALVPAVTLFSIVDYWTIPALILLPLTLGYTVLRYQFLVFDALVARVVTWLLRGVGLVLCVYLGLICFVLCPLTPVTIVVLVGTFGGLSIGMWSLACRIATALLFAEAAQDRQMMVSMLETPAQTHDLPTLVRTLHHLVTLTCGSQDAFLLVRDEASGLYRLAEALPPAAMGRLEQVLSLVLAQRYPAPPAEEFSVASEVATHLAQARRPSFLWELTPKEEPPIAPPPDAAQMLLVGLPTAGQLLGILIVDTRSDQQPYAGPDFEMVRELTMRVLPVLVASVQHAAKAVQIEALEEALHQTTLLSKLAPEDFATALVDLVARSLPAQVELWERRERFWHRLAMAGAHEDAWSTEQTRRFLNQDEEHRYPVFEPQGLLGHPLPFVLLPLEGDPSRADRLLAHYSRPSVFLPEHRQMLALAALHVGRMLEEVRQRADAENAPEPALSPALLAALRSFLTTVGDVSGAQHETFTDFAERTRLREHWLRIQAVAPLWSHPALPPKQLISASASSEIVLLVVSHPLLTDVLVRACAWQGSPVVVRQTARQSLRWLQEAPRRLAAVVLDEEALSLDLELFVHAVREYVSELPPFIVFPALHQSTDERVQMTQVTYLPKPFRLEYLFLLLGWTLERS